MRWLALIVPALAIAQPAAPPVASEDAMTASIVKVKVVDVAGGLAFLEPGEEAGIAVGSEVRIGKRSFKVIAVSAGYAAIELGDLTVKPGDRGTATATRVAAKETERMATPQPLSSFEGQWREAKRPSEGKKPDPVPLGQPGSTTRVRGALYAATSVVSPSDGPSYLAGFVGGRISAEVFSELGMDADAAAQIWSGEGLAGSDDVHPVARVRELRLRWGEARDPRVALGRLRWTSLLLGQLDGGRVSAPVGPLKLAAWGGEIPDEITGAPSTKASAFGVEAELDQPETTLMPHVTLSAGGTTWEGQLDERRVALDASIESGSVRALGFAEAAAFSADNPWGADTLELQAASVDLSSRLGRARIAGRFGARRPERSLRLAAILPPEWLCQRDPRSPGEEEPCAYAPLRKEAMLAAGWSGGRVNVDGGVSAYHSREADLDVEITGFAMVGVGLGHRMRLDVGADGGRVDWLDWQGGTIGIGRLFWRDRLDVGLRYGFTRLISTGSLGIDYEHRAGGRAALDLRAMSVTGDVAVIRGAGADAILGMAMAVWRLP